MIDNKDANFEEKYISISDTYSWRGEKFPDRLQQHQRQKRSINKMMYRKDEPELGALVFAENIAILQNYLIGYSRSPFNNPRKNMVIVLYQLDEDWKIEVALFLEKLWKDYAISKVVLIAPCEANTEKVLHEGFCTKFKESFYSFFFVWDFYRFMQNIFHLL